MNADSPEQAPPLAPAGAGLPWLELQVARLGFGWMSRRTTREQAAALLTKERTTLLQLARSCDAQTGARRTLIARLRGMEDSSRFWSVYMTLDHLRIVNRAVAEAIRQLGRGQVPPRTASTAAVKPGEQADDSVIDEFDRSCALVEQCAARLPNLKTAVRYAHPWFGPLDAAAWHFLAAFHLGLHRRQVEEILRRLD